MSNARAVRYRRLALAADDKTKADLLLKLAEWRSAWPCRTNEQPRKPEELKAWRAE